MLTRLQQRLYRWIVPDSALSGWRSFEYPPHVVNNLLNYVVWREAFKQSKRMIIYERVS